MNNPKMQANSLAIKFDNVGKQYKKGKRLLKEALIDAAKLKRSEAFWALDNVNFNLPKGEVLGVLGPNGSGKSTLLKLIAGVTEPTRGKVAVSGRVAPLIELGAGFHFELTGRENIYINGSILGLKKAEIDRKLAEIIAFAELNEFIDTPIKHYSSGMFMRLGFSVAIHVDPDILLIDEILAVGDLPFQNKCFAKMKEFTASGMTMVIVSHQVQQLKQFCTRGLVVWQGKQAYFGDIGQAIDKYQELLEQKYGQRFNNGGNSHLQ